jgi:hypothetical protein
MMTQNTSALNTPMATTIMQPSKTTTRSSWRYAAFGGAVLCSILGLAYTLAFILYALARSALTVLTTVNQDAGMLGTLIATWASLIVASLIIGALCTIAVAILGAITGIIVKAVSVVLNPQNEPQRAAVIGAGVCFAIVLFLHFALRAAMSYALPDLLSMHAVFWLELPSAIFIVAGGVAARQLTLML